MTLYKTAVGIKRFAAMLHLCGSVRAIMVTAKLLKGALSFDS